MKVTVEKTFRGRTYPKLVQIDSVSYKADYRLLHKHEEEEYCRVAQRTEKIVPREIDLPPLLKEFVLKETGQSDKKIAIKLKPGHNSIYRLAKEGEKPTFDVGMNLGKPASPSLYANCDL